MKELTIMCQEINNLGRKSYKLKDILAHPVHHIMWQIVVKVVGRNNVHFY